MHGIFEIANVPTPAELIEYPKVASIFELLHMGLPTLSGLILGSWNEEVASRVSDYILSRGWSQVVVRSDTRFESRDSPRGGYLCAIPDLGNVIGPLISLGRVAILLEPINRYQNQYGLNLMIVAGSGNALLEIVGPGFDVSDLNRGEITPHERISLGVHNNRVTPRVLHRDIVTPADYSASVTHRLAKIGREALHRQVNSLRQQRGGKLEEIGQDFLQTNGFSRLDQSKYAPLPEAYLLRLLSYIRRLPSDLPVGGPDAHYVVSVSIIGEGKSGRYIFWDVVRSRRKYWITSP